MYGMTHRAIRDMVIETAGPDAWGELERRLGIGPADLISAMVYPDEQTIGLLAAAAEQLELDLSECLRQFGRFWVRFAATGDYAGIMDFVADDFPGFIRNLDRMHQAVQVAMPEARVPEFSLVYADQSVVRVAYRSTRAGLEPMVVGLLEGLLMRFGLRGTVRQVTHGEAGAEFDVALATVPTP